PAHAVPDQRGPLETGGVEQADDPAGQFRDGPQRRPVGPAVTGQVHRQHGPLMMRDIAALRAPDRMIHARPVQEQDGQADWVEGAPAGRREYPSAIDLEQHALQPFCEARSAWARSSMMSAASSMPTDSRI